MLRRRGEVRQAAQGSPRPGSRGSLVGDGEDLRERRAPRADLRLPPRSPQGWIGPSSGKGKADPGPAWRREPRSGPTSDTPSGSVLAADPRLGSRRGWRAAPDTPPAAPPAALPAGSPRGAPASAAPSAAPPHRSIPAPARSAG